MEQKALQPPNSTREGFWMRGPTSMPLAPSCTIWGQGMPRRGDKKQDREAVGEICTFLWGDVSEQRKRALPECPGSVRRHWKNWRRAYLQNVIYHFSGLPQQAAGAESGLHIPHLARSDICGRKGVSCLYREQNDTGAVRRLASRYGLVPDEHGIYYMDGPALKPGYSDVVQLEQPVFEVILDDCGTGPRRFWRGV